MKKAQNWMLEIRYIDKPFESEGKSMLTYLNEARESEQKRIARELHDGIAQSIYSLMLETRGLKWTPVEEHQQKLQGDRSTFCGRTFGNQEFGYRIAAEHSG